MNVYEAKERARISAWQEDAKFFMNEFVNEEIDAHHPGISKDDVAPLGTWAASYHEKADIASQGALAAVSYVASKGIKRLREQASQGAAAATTLAETMKQNEELQAQNAKLQKDYEEAMTLCDERQKGLETLQAELIKGGLMNEKFNFSKLTSREKAGGAARGGGCGRRGDALARGRQGRGLQGGCGSVVGQPDPAGGPAPVAAGRSNGGLRMGPAAPTTRFLGASNGEPDIGSILRGAGHVMSTDNNKKKTNTIARVVAPIRPLFDSDRQQWLSPSISQFGFEV